MANVWWRNQWQHYLANQSLARCLEHIARFYQAMDVPKDYSSNTNEEQLLVHAKRLIDDNIEAYHSAQLIAEQLGVSREKLRAVFVRNTNETPATAIRNRRLALAQDMLSATSMSMASIAQQLGFRSTSSFSQFCLKYLGSAPTHWQRTHHLSSNG